MWDENHVTPFGYGWLSFDGRKIAAHRFVLGEPEGTVDHVCHNEAATRGKCAGGVTCLHRRCVNPSHLMVGTAGENLAASPLTTVYRRFDTHCREGHEYTEWNSLWGWTGKPGKRYRTRRCRACRYEYNRQRTRKKK